MHVVNVTIDRPAPGLIDRFRACWMECVVQALAGTNALMDSAIKPLTPRCASLIGPAVTVSPHGTDTLMGMAGVAVAQSGDVIVMAARGDCRAGIWGGGLTLSAKLMGVAGVVVDGAALDAPAILEHDIPVFCRTSTLNHTVGRLPGSVNIDVMCGGAPVSPGDLIMGSLDGVLVVPKAALESVLADAEARTARIIEAKARIAPGHTLFEMRGGRPLLESLGVVWND
jgi:4-hydroxy-4-methyl-2-oxoglutarate aldolase